MHVSRGKGADLGLAIDVDSSNNVFVTGCTVDAGVTDLPTTTGAYDEVHNGSVDVFVAKFNNTLTTLSASTFLGGSGSDEYGLGIVVDPSNNIFVTGRTDDAGTDLPTTGGAYDTTHNGSADVFVAKFNNTLTTLSASMFLGERI